MDWTHLLAAGAAFALARLLAARGRPTRAVGQPRRPQYLAEGQSRAADQSWREATAFDVIVVGASSAGLTLAAKLQAAGLDYVCLERNARSGDQWRSRYDRLHLHTHIDISALPGVPFPDWYPTFVGKDALADYYDAAQHFFRVKTQTEVARARFDSAAQRWTVETSSGQRLTSRALVFCSGQESAPVAPEFDGLDAFERAGGQVMHSAAWRNGAAFRGRSVLVVGFGNSGAEIALDLHEHGASAVTAVARSPLHIITRDMSERLAPLYTLARHYIPVPIHDALIRLSYSVEPELRDLRQLGFRVRKSGCVSDLVNKHEAPLQDIGTLDLVRQGVVKVVPCGVRRFTASGVEFEDGSSVDGLDAVVLATGFDKGSPAHSRFLDEETCEAARGPYGVVVSGRPILVRGEHVRLYAVGMNDQAGRLREMHIDGDAIVGDLMGVLRS